MNATRVRPTVTTAQAVCLVAAPLLLVIARSVLVPYWDDAAKYITQVGDDPARSDFGASLVIGGALLLIPAILTLAGLLSERMPRLAVVGAALAVVGAVSMACVASATLVAGQAVRLGDHDAAVALWDRVWNTSKIWPILTVHVGSLGFIVLAFGLYRARVVPRGAALLVGLGGAAMMTTSAGPVRPLLIAAATLALIGFGWVALTARGGSFTASTAEASARPAIG